MWRMDLRQLTVYEYFAWANMRDISFLVCGPKCSSRRLEKFSDDIPSNPEVIIARAAFHSAFDTVRRGGNFGWTTSQWR